jgi:hydroxypyruvate isomerase
MLELLLRVSTCGIEVRAGLVDAGIFLIGQQGQSADLEASIGRQNYEVNGLYFHSRITTGNMSAALRTQVAMRATQAGPEENWKREK